jgi:hypothetical protein
VRQGKEHRRYGAGPPAARHAAARAMPAPPTRAAVFYPHLHSLELFLPFPPGARTSTLHAGIDSRRRAVASLPRSLSLLTRRREATRRASAPIDGMVSIHIAPLLLRPAAHRPCMYTMQSFCASTRSRCLHDNL